MAVMNLLPKDNVFFDQLDHQTRTAVESIQLLQAVLAVLSAPADSPQDDIQSSLSGLVAKSQAVKADARRHFDILTRALCETFITPFDREDLQQLASILYKIPKLAEKTAERLSLSVSAQSTRPLDDEFTRFAALFGQSALSLKTLMATLQAGSNKLSPELSNVVHALDTVESDADRLFGELLTTLYKIDNGMPYQEFFLRRELYGMLEKMTDITRDLGHTTLRLILKHS